MIQKIDVSKPIRDEFVGVVTSDKMDKTVVAEVERTFKHPLVGKVLKRKKKYKIHDESNESRIGDIIAFIQTRPLSKTKYMRFVRIIKKGS